VSLRHVAGAVVLALGLAAAGGCGGALSGPSIPTTTPAGTSEEIPIELSKPDGAGPFPAVVIMHDCSGLGPRSSGAPGRWAKELVKQGYVVVLPDSFTTRGHPDGVCTDAVAQSGRREPGATGARRVRGARLPAHLALRRRLAGRAHGGSHGGSTTLSSMIAPESDADLLASERRGGFAAAVALYPGCVAITADLERHGPVSARRAALDPDRRQGRLDAGRAVSKVNRRRAAGRIPRDDQDLSRRLPLLDSYNPVRYVPRGSTRTRRADAARRRAGIPRRGPTASARSTRSSARHLRAPGK
jgi:dienelactone hydrolase